MEIAALHFPHDTPPSPRHAPPGDASTGNDRFADFGATTHASERLLELGLRVADLLAAADVHGVALPMLWMGKPGCAVAPGPCALFCLDTTRADVAAAWADRLAALGYPSLLACAADSLGAPGRLHPRDLQILAGYGMVTASVGLSGRPLVGLRLSELREELRLSRERLEAACGLPVYTLCPRPDRLGRTVDGLVLDEARRAGYRLILEPGMRVIDDALLEHEAQALPARRIEPDDHPFELRRWVLGDGFARKIARVRHVAETPARLWSGLLGS